MDIYLCWLEFQHVFAMLNQQNCPRRNIVSIESDEYTLLCELAYQSWLDRGQPMGSPETDWIFAKAQIGLHAPVVVTNLEREQLDVTDDA